MAVKRGRQPPPRVVDIRLVPEQPAVDLVMLVGLAFASALTLDISALGSALSTSTRQEGRAHDLPSNGTFLEVSVGPRLTLPATSGACPSRRSCR